MKIKALLVLSALFLSPTLCFAAGEAAKNVHFFAELVAVLNFILLITCLLCLKQFFFPGGVNRTPFQLFNAIFIIFFYFISLYFIINNKDYYQGFEQLSSLGCIKKIFFDREDIMGTLKQWLVVFTFIINLIYIQRNWKDQYYAG